MFQLPWTQQHHEFTQLRLCLFPQHAHTHVCRARRESVFAGQVFCQQQLLHVFESWLLSAWGRHCDESLALLAWKVHCGGALLVLNHACPAMSASKMKLAQPVMDACVSSAV